MVAGDTFVPHNVSVISSTRRRNTPARYISKRFFYRGFPAAVAFNDGSLERDTFKLSDIELHFTGGYLEMPFVMPGTVALTVTGALIFVRIDQFISFFVE